MICIKTDVLSAQIQKVMSWCSGNKKNPGQISWGGTFKNFKYSPHTLHPILPTIPLIFSKCIRPPPHLRHGPKKAKAAKYEGTSLSGGLLSGLHLSWEKRPPFLSQAKVKGQSPETHSRHVNFTLQPGSPGLKETVARDFWQSVFQKHQTKPDLQYLHAVRFLQKSIKFSENAEFENFMLLFL
jgi:hypothetical protein